MLTRTALIALTLTLAGGCCRAGAAPPSSLRPSPVVTERGPCLTQPPPTANPELVRLASLERDLTNDEEAWLWTWIEVLESRLARDWRTCGVRR